MKKRQFNLSNLLVPLLFLIGLSILLYPTISSRWNAYISEQTIGSYNHDVQKMDHKDLDRAWEQAKAYNGALNEPSVPDAFSIRDGIRDPYYEKLLNVNRDGIMGSISIPTIHVKLPLYHYTTKDVMLKGAGHLLGSSLPVGGKGTHAVISAHRGLPSAKMFTDLNLLKKGDHFFLHILDRSLAYKVDRIMTVKPEEVKSLAPVKGKDYVTLVTCTPYGVNTHRLLVRGHRVAYSPKLEHREGQNRKFGFGHGILEVLSAVAGMIGAWLLFKLYRKMQDKRQKRNAGDELK
jgi:sortase A